ncbi:MAG: cysteine desulfurase [Alphaproteobacteria bacterium]|nr:cysteine desulfurase [Alphaproteobacteria bacterium]
MAEQSAITPNPVDISKYRDDFPVLSTKMNGKPLAFLDSGASAQKPTVVIAAMDAVLNKGYSNIHRGLYSISQKLTEDFEAVRVRVSRFINAPSEKNIVFTRNTTDAINLVAQSWGKAHLTASDEIILSEMEHHANIVPWQLLQQEIGFTIRTIPFDERGVLDMQAFERALNQHTKFVGVVHTSNALGTINPVKKIVEIAKDFYPDIKVLVDGSQSVVHGVVDVADIGCDFFTFTGHKIYGPTGIGVLYGREEVLASMPPYQGGGDMIERVSFNATSFKEPPYRFEAGTPPIVEVIGLGVAIDYVSAIGMANIAAHEAGLLTYATQKLQDIDGLKIHGTAPDKAGILSFTMDGAHPSDIGMILDQCGVAVRSGHHCCMPLMERLGLDATARASLGLYSNKADIDQLIEGLKKVGDMFS